MHGCATRPWSDFAEVRVTGMRPRWLFIVSLGYRVVAFIGQPGVHLAPLPSAKVAGRMGGYSRVRSS